MYQGLHLSNGVITTLYLSEVLGFEQLLLQYEYSVHVRHYVSVIRCKGVVNYNNSDDEDIQCFRSQCV